MEAKQNYVHKFRNDEHFNYQLLQRKLRTTLLVNLPETETHYIIHYDIRWQRYNDKGIN